MAASLRGVGGGVGRDTWAIGRTGGLLTRSDLEVGGEDVEAVEDGEVDWEEMDCGRGAIGAGASPVARLYAGYPSQTLPDRTHLLHCGLVSSHLTLRFLQLLHPVLRRAG